MGGGINAGTGLILFRSPDSCSLTLSAAPWTTIRPSAARRLGTNGGDAWGGGVSVLAGSSAAIDDTLIMLNAALGGSAGTGGASGQGLGGGLFIDAGAGVTLSKSTRVILNFASTSDHNIYGVYTTS